MKRLFGPGRNHRKPLAVLALAILGWAAQAGATQASTLHHVSVGVSRYAHLPQQSQLQFAHKDAQDLSAIWQGQQGKLYQKVEGETLVDAQATRRGILEALERLNQRAKAGDTAAVLLSGHGGYGNLRDPEWYYLPFDFVPADHTATALAGKTLRSQLVAMAKRGVRVILIIDACHSGGFGNLEGDMIVMTACLPDQTTLESPAWNNGIFTRALIEALQGKGDSNHDGVVTLAELDAYIAIRVPELFRLNRKGTPEPQPTCGRSTTIPSSLPLIRLDGGKFQAVPAAAPTPTLTTGPRDQ